MTIVTSPLATLEDFRACENLQQQLLGDKARCILTLPALAAIRRSGGLLLGAWEEGARPTLRGALVDLVAEADARRARFTVFLGVRRDSANSGIGQSLRRAERTACVEAGAELVYWWADPLRSEEAHIAFNRLGAIAVAHCRNALGPLTDRLNAGLATDRLRVEWWLHAPRVEALIDNAREPAHRSLAFDQMQVITQTKGRPQGQRAIAGLGEGPTKRFVLVEIPTDIASLLDRDPEAARRWRLTIRDAFELLFSVGYTIVGFVHEGGRSFHLLEHADRGEILGRS